MNFIIAQILRIFSAIFCIIADKSNDTKKIYIYNGIYNFLSGIQYYLLGAFAGAISSFVAILRNIIFSKQNKKSSLFVLIVYLIFAFIINLFTYNGIISLLPIIMVIIYTIAIYRANVIEIKYVVIITCILEIIYDIYYKAYVGIIICIIDMVLVTISLIKLKTTKLTSIKLKKNSV